MIDIKKDTEELLKKEYGISETVTREMFASGIIHEHTMRRVLIRHEYRRKVKPKQKQFVRNDLASKYCVSVKLVEKIVLENT